MPGIIQRLHRGGSCAAIALFACAPAAQAEETGGWRKGDVVVTAGVAAILFNSSAEIALGVTRIEGGNIKLSNNALLSGSAEYFATRNVSVALVAGIPPTTRVTGTGTLAPSGELGRVKYGLASLVARYHLNASRPVSPYLGAGVSRFIVFSTRDGSVTGLKADNAWAPVVQGGIDYHLSRHIGIFANATWIPVKTRASGTSRGLPLTGSATLKSAILKGGLSYRF
jgi:outer membrane protein